MNAVPRTRRSSPSANAPAGTAACSARRPGYSMARCVAAQLADAAHTPFLGADMSTKLKLLGVDVGSIGDAHGATRQPELPFHRRGQRQLPSPDRLRRWQARAGRRAGRRQQLLRHPAAVRAERHQAAGRSVRPDPAADRGAPTLGPDALPASATICSCHNVSKRARCAASRCRRHRSRRTQGRDQGGHRLRRLQCPAQAGVRRRTGGARRGG